MLVSDVGVKLPFYRGAVREGEPSPGNASNTGLPIQQSGGFKPKTYATVAAVS
jgi:hypothetical protein